jgi:hypothetical protein
MGEWALPGRREPSVHGRPPERAEAAQARGALAARRVLAQLPGEVPRDQRPPQADAPDIGEGRGDAARTERTLALDHLYQGQSNDCYWHGLFGGIYIAAHAGRERTST